MFYLVIHFTLYTIQVSLSSVSPSKGELSVFKFQIIILASSSPEAKNLPVGDQRTTLTDR